MSKHFFITGGTGLVGKNLIPRLLSKFPDSTITLLVRGEDEGEANERTQNIARQIADEFTIPDAPERIEGILGDVGLDHCGLNPAQIERIVKEATHIVHGAATIRFDHPIDEARALNCGGTKRLLSIAHMAAERGRLERFVYIGSSSVSGQRGGHIYEDELEMGQKFFNTYEQSKNESERIVRNNFDKIPCTVFRPSIIIGDSRTGKTSSFNVIYIPLRLVQKGLLTYVPGTPDTLMDLVPIDWVDDAMVHILTKEESVGKVFHITAGPNRAARLDEVVVAAVKYFDKHTPLKHPRTMEFISKEEYEKRRSAMRGREDALMSQLDTLLPYVTVNRLFDSSNADKLLEGSGIEFPLFKNYSDKIFGYCVKTNWGRAEADD
ncbi:MAG: SDR family oxidoreductase [Bacteroidetes bacterium]|nr:SDR family oxidoreductase [Bacteroidota bacterium]MCW5896497.1 SDR family oxidoreductase [Bacteroidota bacterium]